MIFNPEVRSYHGIGGFIGKAFEIGKRQSWPIRGSCRERGAGSAAGSPPSYHPSVVLFVNMVKYREGRRAVSSRRATEAYPSGTPQGAELWSDRPTTLECHRIYEQDHLDDSAW